MIFFIIAWQALFSRLSGSGFGSRWNLPWLPEFLFSIPFGVAHAYAWHYFGFSMWYVIPALFIATAISYVGMQSATWMFLRWTEHTPNRERKSTLKPIVDFIAKRFGYELGDEGYSWIAAGLKGFLIGLPVGGLPLAVLWPLGYECGTHMKIYKDESKEVFAGVGAGISIVLFLFIISII